MRYERNNSFKRSFKKLPNDRQEQVIGAIQSLRRFYDLKIKPEGLGLKRLREDVWEIRSSLKDRILFSFVGDAITFLIVGNHDDIRRYLKSL